MIIFTTKLEVVSRVGAQFNERFREWHENQRRDTSPMKSNGSKTSSTFEKVGNIRSTS